MDGGVAADSAAPVAAFAALNPPLAETTKRRVFYVKLSATECTEINYKDLVRDYERIHGVAAASSAPVAKPQAIDTTGSDPGSALNSPHPEEMVGGLPLSTPRTQRFDIIEHLEKRYGAGAVVGRPVQAADADGDSDNEGFVRGDDDNLYDSEDSFIDDEELHQNIEEIHTQARVKTKHSGFFVNAGDAIETIESEDPRLNAASINGDTDAVPSKKAKRPKKNGGAGGAESTKAARAFIDEWSDAASEWQPGAEIIEGIEALRCAVQELGTNITKTFPRQLDNALRAVDRLVVDAHPNKWRVNGYFATLMTFLPFTKQYLKTNMLRLEARDATRAIKDEMETAIEALATEIDVYAKRVGDDGAAVETIKQGATHANHCVYVRIRGASQCSSWRLLFGSDILNDKELALRLHRLLLMQDEWITKENDYRQMLKSDDKKLMKEVDYAPLNARQERNRLYNRVLALFPANGLMDLPSLRSLSKAGKSKGGGGGAKKQSVATATTTSAKTATTTAATATSKSPATTPKRKLPVVVVAEVAPSSSSGTPAKRSIKPFKSRLMDEAPRFVDQDFVEIA